MDKSESFGFDTNADHKGINSQNYRGETVSRASFFWKNRQKISPLTSQGTRVANYRGLVAKNRLYIRYGEA